MFNYDFAELTGKVIIYLRKSREEVMNGIGVGLDQTLERHEEILQSWAINNLGYKIPNSSIYKEVISGESIKNRPVMMHVMNMIKNKEVSAVLTVDPQRLSRGDLVDCGNLMQALEYSDVKVLTPTYTYDLKIKHDKKAFRNELLQGNEYLEYNKEILARGRIISSSQGKYVGSNPPFGYDRIKLNGTKGFTLVPNDDAKYIKKIFDMFVNERKTIYYITDWCNENEIGNKDNWYKSNVRRILKNNVYNGKIVWDRYKENKEFNEDGELIKKRKMNPDYKIFNGLHEAIIDDDTFNKAQVILNNNVSFPRTDVSKLINPLAGLVKCGICGKTMVLVAHHNEKRTVRKYKLDKEALMLCVYEHYLKQDKSKSEIAKILDVPTYTVDSFITKNTRQFPTKGIILEKWYDLKSVLNIQTTEFDKPLTEFITVERNYNLACFTPKCTNHNIALSYIEDEVLRQLQDKINNMHIYLSDYESKTVKVIEGNTKAINRIDKKLDKLDKELKNALRKYNSEEYTTEEYLFLKNEILEDIESAKKEKEQLVSTNHKDIYIEIKKQIPNFEKCLCLYDKLTAQQKNEMLRSIISEIHFTKLSNKNSSPKNNRDFTLEIIWKI